MAKKSIYNPHQLLIDFNVIEEDLFLLGDVKNIRFMLPKLFETQHEDVAAAEKRFKEGKGYLFTNGTGTGKTFVGLGIAKRFYLQGKVNILIVVPTEKKSIDWVEDGAYIDLKIVKLDGVNDKGNEVTVTTYANFYQNERLNERHWDLIIYDESHYLNQNEQGKQTCYLEQHKQLANVPSTARQKAFEYPGVYTEEFREDGEIVRHLNKELFDKVYMEYIEKTKVVFLSATPFAYHKSVQYADGCLFEINEQIVPQEQTSYAYNEPSGWEKFMVENFGYRMKYNKVTIPESGVDVNLLERNFFESFKEKGIMSTRQLNLDYDYSREFVTIDSEVGKFIDDGLELFYQKEFIDRFPKLSEKSHRKFNYNYINQLLECIKAKEIHTRIKQHLLLDRKVVIFHNYNNSSISHPFRFEAQDLLNKDDKWDRYDLEKEINMFRDEYPHYWNLDLSDLNNTRASIKKHFPDAREFNGTINKKLRDTYTREFNTDNSFTDVIIVQIKAGKEGISLHDKTGVHQRVLINLGLPTAPTDAIQSEGRIYREGLKSNAIYEYITLQTNTERYAFATKIAERSKTAENLAMGNLARDLELAFKEGYVNSSFDEPSLNQGTGGKEADKFLFTISEFDKAKTFYWQRGKKTSKNKSKEGVDYFATPEPLGFKILDWLKPQPNERGLEPSAGHGAIARWFPGDTTNHFVEPSYYLTSELAINANGNIHNHSFEDYYIGNKFEFIAMNPPFGTAGKTAMEHVAKACKHLSWRDARLIAIVPAGPSMQKRLDAFFEHPDYKEYVLTGEINLPSVLFERAGTSVVCKIIKIELRKEKTQHSFDPFSREYRPINNNQIDFVSIDLSHIGDINEFFNEIETLEF